MNGELIALFEYYEKEMGIDPETLVKAVEEGITAAASRRKDEATRGLKVSIDRRPEIFKPPSSFLLLKPFAMQIWRRIRKKSHRNCQAI